jgi:hypothetical protein
MVDERETPGDDPVCPGITLGIQKYPLTWGYPFAKVSDVPGSARQPGLDDRVFRATPSGRARGKTAPVHEAEATPGGARSHAAKRRAPGNRGDERRSSFGAPSSRLAGGHGQRGTGRGHGGTPTAPEEPFGSEASPNEGTGNRVSVNGARMLVRATGAGSSFGNGGRFADKTGSKGHRCRATGSGAIGCGAGQPETVANMGIARRAFGHDGRCVGRAKANARRSTSGGWSQHREAPGGCAGARRPHRPGRLTFSARFDGQ